MLNTSIEQREYSYNEVARNIIALGEQYRFVDVFTIGTSVLGRPIYAARIGVKDNDVLYAGGFHGSERLTSLTLLIFLEQFCRALESGGNFNMSSARNALFGKSVTVVPVVNPDGYEISRAGASTAGDLADRIREINGTNDIKYWNANARGVDINHNFNAGFDRIKEIERNQGITGPSPRRYGGTAPESEPETIALVNYCRTHFVAQAIAYHSQGEEIYWQYGDNTPEKSLQLAQLFATASSYTLASPAPYASFAGFKDWFLDEFGRPAFTLEIGIGENPLSPSQLYDIYNQIEELILISIALA